MTKIALLAIMLLLIVTTLLTAAPGEDISTLSTTIGREFGGKRKSRWQLQQQRSNENGGASRHDHLPRQDRKDDSMPDPSQGDGFCRPCYAGRRRRAS